MIAIADATADERLSARRIAESMAIPAQFVPRVMHALVRAHLVEARTGRSGGYRLARPARRISLLEIIDAVEADSRRARCVIRGGACGSDGGCAAHAIFFRAQEAMLDQLASASLADLVRAAPVMGAA
jgi:Rrf2 family protein